MPKAVYIEQPANTVHHGDCRTVLPQLPADSFDAIISDPPYGLSDAGGLQSMSDRIFDTLRKVGFPDLYKRYAEFGQSGDLAGVAIRGSTLRGVNRSVRVRPGVGVPESPVNFQNDTTVEQEIDARDVSPGTRVANTNLPVEDDTASGEFLGDFILDLGDVNPRYSPGNVSGGRLAEVFTDGFALPVVTPGSSCFGSFSGGGTAIVDGGDNGWRGDNPQRKPDTPPGIVALPGAVNTLMLRFDVGGRPTELLATRRAGDDDGSQQVTSTKLIRTLATASGLSSVAEPNRVRFVVSGADGTHPTYWLHVWTPPKVRIQKMIPSGGFMGKRWDAMLPDPEVWRECFRVAKPGAYLAVFGGTRTYHRLTCAIEDAGWEIRDCLMWMYGTGFPKGKANLKPAWEPVVLARKSGGPVLPFEIDTCRIPTTDKLGGGDQSASTKTKPEGWDRPWMQDPAAKAAHAARVSENVAKAESLGRWPANVLHDGSDEVLEAFAAFGDRGGGFGTENRAEGTGIYGKFSGSTKGKIVGHGDSGTAARFFYCAKPSSAERGDNRHPTLKPIALMRWLVRLITPPGGTVLDPFAGSGTTGVAAKLEGRGCVLIEQDPEHAATARRRIAECRV